MLVAATTVLAPAPHSLVLAHVWALMVAAVGPRTGQQRWMRCMQSLSAQLFSRNYRYGPRRPRAYQAATQADASYYSFYLSIVGCCWTTL